MTERNDFCRIHNVVVLSDVAAVATKSRGRLTSTTNDYAFLNQTCCFLLSTSEVY